MGPEQLADGIASPDPGVREAALERLSSAGAEAVAPLIAVLCDEKSPVEWSRPAVLLREIGDAAFDPLVEAMATAPNREVARRAGWAFCGLKVSTVERYLPALRHPSPKVRGDAAYVLQLRGKDARPYVPELLPLLADPEPDVRQRAIWALTEIGPGGVVPQLKRLRRKGKTPQLRRRALHALAEVAGPAKLDPTDLALLRRLIAVKLHGEVPAPMDLTEPWFAIHSADRAAVLDAFGLAEPEPVTMRLGESIWHNDRYQSGWLGVPHASCSRVYVSPVLDGWTCVFGWPAADHHSRGELLGRVSRERTVELSRRFGTAHWYGMSHGDAWSGWCLAEAGEIVRAVDNDEEPSSWIGGPHPAEAGLNLDFDDLDTGLEDADAVDVAAAASVDLTALGPHTVVEGHGLVALTECGLKRGHPRGALRF